MIVITDGVPVLRSVLGGLHFAKMVKKKNGSDPDTSIGHTPGVNGAMSSATEDHRLPPPQMPPQQSAVSFGHSRSAPFYPHSR